MSGFIKKIWKDRVTEFPTRRSLTKQDGSVELVTVAREEGTVSQEGDAFSAQNMNDLEERVKTAFDDVDSSLTASDNLKFRFATDGEGNYGYLGADDSFVPFSSGKIALLCAYTTTSIADVVAINRASDYIQITSNIKITILKKCKFRVTFTSPSTQENNIRLYKNGVEIGKSYSGNNFVFSDEIECNAGDYFTSPEYNASAKSFLFEVIS